MKKLASKKQLYLMLVLGATFLIASVQLEPLSAFGYSQAFKDPPDIDDIDSETESLDEYENYDINADDVDLPVFNKGGYDHDNPQISTPIIDTELQLYGDEDEGLEPTIVPERPDHDFKLIEDGWYVRDFPANLSSVEFSFTKRNGYLYTDFEESISLEGAIFNLYTWDYDDYDWILLREDVESDEDGLVQLGELDSGNLFRLVETVAPEGFRLPEGHWYIEIAEDGEITITRSLDEDENQREDVPFIFHEGGWFVGNTMIEFTSFIFFKMDELMYSDFENAELLEGAAFEIFRYENGDWVLAHTETSDEYGRVEFTPLTLGATYKLVEVSAPEGYEIPQGHWLIEIDDEEITITAEGDSVPAFRTYDGIYFLGNIAELELPILGGLGINRVLIAIGLLTMIIAGCMFFIIKTRRKMHRL